MKLKPDFQKLRQRIAAQERRTLKSWPSVSLGSPTLDHTLPGGGLAAGALHEFLPATPGDIAALAGFSLGVLAQILRMHAGFVLLALPSFHALREGAFYPVGLTALGCDPDRLVQLRAPKSENVLWAMEEGLENPALAAVVGVLPGNDRAYDFTASRRLAMRAAASGVTALLIRSQRAPGEATAAQTRWSIAAAPSEARAWAGGRMPGLGAPQWQVELTKSKSGALGEWRVRWDDETFSFRLAAALADRAPVRGSVRASVAVSNTPRRWVAAS
jgi:protein ImuA